MEGVEDEGLVFEVQAFLRSGIFCQKLAGAALRTLSKISVADNTRRPAADRVAPACPSGKKPDPGVFRFAHREQHTNDSPDHERDLLGTPGQHTVRC
mmetsp:Transcript_27010/g.59397  ORF Transcript_27010/g.59397 Transcript_27010/m.59397 type:complete len:97 (-) Transcript_27010:52-342(-)